MVRSLLAVSCSFLKESLGLLRYIFVAVEEAIMFFGFFTIIEWYVLQAIKVGANRTECTFQALSGPSYPFLKRALLRERGCV